MRSPYELFTAGHLGAIPEGDGCDFRVWAPSAERVEVLVEGRGAIALEPGARGYHAGSVPGVGPGDRYRFRLDGGEPLPDPASRFQPDGVHGPSEAVGPDWSGWADGAWEGLPLDDFVLYELHVGTFSSEGTFDAAVGGLDDLAALGVTAVEVMPVAQFSGGRNWGYDGVFPYAVQDTYGGPAAFKRFVDECHRRGLALVLDVVYNHLGPEGNVLPRFGPYFTDRYQTPWGDAVNLDGPGSDKVRRYFGGSALRWLDEFHVDALRIDAVHSIVDMTARPFLLELSEAVGELAERSGRRLHLIAESADNDPRVTAPGERGGLGMDAQWNDDFHHALHVALTGERHGYYIDYDGVPDLAVAMREGFVLQGRFSAFRGRRHGAPLDDPRPDRLVVFAQNHDQVGNRLGGERLPELVSFERQKLAAGAVLLSPYLPLLFQGEEYGETAPFPYFVGHSDPGLVAAVRTGRREEFAAFGWEGETPDPRAESTFASARLNRELRREGRHELLWELHRELIRVRRDLGPVRGVELREGLLVLRREGSVALLNFGEEPAEVPDGARGLTPLVDSADERWGGPGSMLPESVAPTSFALLAAEPR